VKSESSEEATASYCCTVTQLPPRMKENRLCDDLLQSGYATLDSTQYPKMPVCLYSLPVQLLHLALLHWFPPAAIALYGDTGVHKSFSSDGVNAEYFQ